MSGHGAELAVYYHTGAPWSTNTRATSGLGSTVSSDQNNLAMVLSPQLAVEVCEGLLMAYPHNNTLDTPSQYYP